jgi:ABC-type multidrug transport system ATPase subunit
MTRTLVHLSAIRRERFVLMPPVVSLGSGDICVVTGRNGSGKSTFLDAIGGFAPAAGAIEIGGTSISTLNSVQRHRRWLSRTFQYDYPRLNVDELVVTANGLSRGGLQTKALDALREFAVGVGHARRLGELSFGQRRFGVVLAALARAMPLTLLDEPLQGLAAEQIAIVIQHLRDYVDAGGTAIVVEHVPVLQDISSLAVRL